MCLEFARSLLGVDSGLTPGLRSQFGVAPEFARSSSGDHAGLSELARIINSIVRPHGARHHSQFTAPWQLAVCHRHFALVCLGTHLRSHLTLLNTTVRGQILTAEHMRVLKTKLVQLLSFPMEFADDEPKIAYSGNRVLLVPHCRRPLSINSWNVRNYALQIFELKGTCETRANFHVSIDHVRSLTAA